MLRLATLPSSTGPFLPGTVSRSSAPRSARTASGSLTRIGTWRWAKFSLAKEVS